MSYKPEPIDTCSVELPESLHKLVEKLAQNNHDLWAQKRIAEGWTYGQNRSDEKKAHPDLVPYKVLTESGKEYDRVTAMEALKAIVALGYQIEPPARESSQVPDPHLEMEQNVLERLMSTEPLELTALLRLWRNIHTEARAVSSKVYKLLGNRFLKSGEPLMAYDVLLEGLKQWQKNVRLKQLLGLALARSGASEQANGVLAQLYEEGKVDGETSGILARTHKDLAFMARTNEEKEQHFGKAYGYYLEGYQEAVSTKRIGWMDDALYNGINAASTCLLLGKREQAETLAEEIKGVCLKKLEEAKDDYWTMASLGEAEIILGELDAARDRYFSAAELAGRNYGDLSTTRRQARLLLGHIGQDASLFDNCFGIPTVVVFSGHMIDQPERPLSRFSQNLQKEVQKEIALRLEKLDAGFGYSSAACGSDILFLEEMLRRKGEINIILPVEKDRFRRESVDRIVPGSDWSVRFDRVLEKASRVIVANEKQTSGNDSSYEYSNLLQHGLAILGANILDTELVPLAVWDRLPGDGPWGTASMLELWRSQGLKPEIIDIGTLGKDMASDQKTPGPVEHAPSHGGHTTTNRPGYPREIKAMLFADVVGYSQLMEEQVPDFVDQFMSLVAELINNSLSKPLTKNTWGDALYFVFSSTEHAGNFALELRDRICGTNWEQKGLPHDLNVRISLHAGPVYECRDPVIERLKYTGSHVSRTARIEPITPPGEVYASQAFAALSAVHQVKGFRLDYAGQIPLPKKSGIIPLYLVRRNRASAALKQL